MNNLNKKKYKVQNMHLLITFGVLLILIIVLSFFSPNYLTVRNIFNILRQRAPLIICCCSMTLLIISGNMDLSIGCVSALAAVVAAKLASNGVNLASAYICGLIAGVLCGVLSGFLVTVCNLPPMIATMSTMYIAEGLAFIISDSSPIYRNLPDSFSWAKYYWLGLPSLLWVSLIIIILFYVILNYTVLGKHIYAIGGNRETARLSGIKVKQITILLYVFSGLLAAVAGILQSSRISSGDPNLASSGLEFECIVATVIGGTSMLGGEGTLVGSLIGALILGNLSNGMNLMGLSQVYQFVIEGVVLIFAVVLDLTLKGNGIDIRRLKEVLFRKQQGI